MRILLTNDDGIEAEGLEILLGIAHQLTTEDNITIVAPAQNQSGVGHCISYGKSVLYEELAPQRVAVHGMPADCVIVALHQVMSDHRPDLILSGVNKGNNAGQNTLYSGTVGATMEAAMQGVRSIALSQFFGPELREHGDVFSAAREHGAEIVDRLVRSNIWSNSQGDLFYNINFPPVLAEHVRGTKATYQGTRAGAPFICEPDGNSEELRILGTNQHLKTAEGSDVAANLDGYVSVTPCVVDLTSYASLQELGDLLE